MLALIKKKIIPTILIISFFAPTAFFIRPERANAIAGVGDVVFDPAQAGLTVAQTAASVGHAVWNFTYNMVLKPLLKSFAKTLARMFVQMIIDATVDWINSGFNGNPAYVSDFGSFMQKTVDRTIGEFIFNNPALNFLCYPFRLQIKLALGLQTQPLYRRIGCTFTGVMNNVNGAYNSFVGGDFIGGGGWNSWLQLTTQPQNNPMGAFLIANAEMQVQIDSAKGSKAQELAWGQGALSFKKCTKNTIGSNGEVISSTQNYTLGDPVISNQNTPAGTENLDTEQYNTASGGPSYDNSSGSYSTVDCTPTSPGAIISEKLKFSENSALRMMELDSTVADGIDAIFSALVNQLAMMAIKTIFNGGLLAGGSEDNGSAYKQWMNEQMLTTQQQANQAWQDTMLMKDGLDPDNSITKVRTEALSRIDTYTKQETDYQTSRNTISSLLQLAKSAFQGAISCNLTNPDRFYFGDNPTLRATLIRDNIIPAIDGPSNPTSYVAPTNLYIINLDLQDSKESIDYLKDKRTEVTTATSSDAIKEIMIPVDSWPYNRVDVDLLPSVKTWLRQQRDSYSTHSCPIYIGGIEKDSGNNRY